MRLLTLPSPFQSHWQIQKQAHQSCKSCHHRPSCTRIHRLWHKGGLNVLSKKQARRNAHDHQGLFVQNSTPTCSLRKRTNVPARGLMRPTAFSTKEFSWLYGGGLFFRAGKPILSLALATILCNCRNVGSLSPPP